MLTKTITYRDIDDVEQTETYCFQLSLAEMSLEVFDKDAEGQTLKDRIERMTEMDAAALRAGGVADLMKLYQEIVKAAVGKREGKLFIKDETVKREFLYSGAYERMFLDMLEQADSGASMIAAMMPSDIRAEVEKLAAKKAKELGVAPGDLLQNSGTVETVAAPAVNPNDPKWMQERRYPTDDELQKMTKAELTRAFKAKSDAIFG